MADGIAPYGTRFIHSASEPVTAKGKGYFGEVRNKDGVSTELSSGDDKGGFPMMVPTLNKDELKDVMAGKRNDSAYEKAQSWADSRRAAGKSPFREADEPKQPTPEGFANGGLVTGGLSRQSMSFKPNEQMGHTGPGVRSHQDYKK